MNIQCKKCRETKDQSEFDFRKDRNKFSSPCKVCRRRQQNQFHKIHPQKYNGVSCYAKTKKYRELASKKYRVSISAIAHHSLKVAIAVFDKYNRKCNRCGSTERLAIHHIDGKGRNYTEAKLRPNNNIDNLELLCIRCHGKIHGEMSGRGHKVSYSDTLPTA